MYYFQVIRVSCRCTLFSLCIAFFLVFYTKLDIYVEKDFCNSQMCSTFSPGLHAEPQYPNQMFSHNTLIGPVYRKHRPDASHLESVKFIPMLNHK